MGRIAVHSRVTCRATVFNNKEDLKKGLNWAKETFGKDWQRARLSGTVIKEVGPHEWLVKFDLDGAEEQLTSHQLQHLRVEDDDEQQDADPEM